MTKIDNPMLRHVLAVTGLRGGRGAPAAIAIGLAEAHDASLTLLYPLMPVAGPLPAGTQGIAQQIEFAQAVGGLRQASRIAQRRGVRVRTSVREGGRAEVLADELEERPEVDLVVAPAKTASCRWDFLSGRLIERLTRNVSQPVLAIHRNDVLDVTKPLSIAVIHWTRTAGISAATRVVPLLSNRYGRPPVSLLRVSDDDARASSYETQSELADMARELKERHIKVQVGTLLTGEVARAIDHGIDIIALANDAPRRPWPCRGAVGRLTPRIDRPVLAL